MKKLKEAKKLCETLHGCQLFIYIKGQQVTHIQLLIHILAGITLGEWKKSMKIVTGLLMREYIQDTKHTNL